MHRTQLLRRRFLLACEVVPLPFRLFPPPLGLGQLLLGSLRRRRRRRRWLRSGRRRALPKLIGRLGARRGHGSTAALEEVRVRARGRAKARIRVRVGDIE